MGARCTFVWSTDPIRRGFANDPRADTQPTRVARKTRYFSVGWPCVGTVQSCLAAPFFSAFRALVVSAVPPFRPRAPRRHAGAILSGNLRRLVSWWHRRFRLTLPACRTRSNQTSARAPPSPFPPRLRMPPGCRNAVKLPHEEKFTFVEKCAELLVIVL